MFNIGNHDPVPLMDMIGLIEAAVGKKAIFNARKYNDRFIFDGDQLAIDGIAVSYEPLCGNCYLIESNGVLNAGRRQWPVAYSFEPDPDFS